MAVQCYIEYHLWWVSFMLSFMLSVIYAECHLYWVSFMLSVIYAECHLCWVSFMLSAIYAECHLCCHLCRVLFMLSVTNKPLMLSVTNKPLMLSVFVLSIVMLSVVMLPIQWLFCLVTLILSMNYYFWYFYSPSFGSRGRTHTLDIRIITWVFYHCATATG